MILRWTHSWVIVSPKSNNCCPYKKKRKHRETQDWRPCEDRGQEYWVTSGATRVGSGEEGVPQKASERTSHAHTLISSFLDCDKVNFCHFKPHSLGHFVMADLENWFSRLAQLSSGKSRVRELKKLYQSHTPKKGCNQGWNPGLTSPWAQELSIAQPCFWEEWVLCLDAEGLLVKWIWQKSRKGTYCRVEAYFYFNKKDNRKR